MKLILERNERCFEPIGRALILHLIVPHIYFSDVVLDNFPFELLAVDRAGTGEAHGVRIYSDLDSALKTGVAEMMSAPSHYRWIAYQGDGILPLNQAQERLLKSQSNLFPQEGMGRIGVLEIIKMENNDLGARLRVKAERFKVSTTFREELAAFVKGHVADIHFDG